MGARDLARGVLSYVGRTLRKRLSAAVQRLPEDPETVRLAKGRITAHLREAGYSAPSIEGFLRDAFRYEEYADVVARCKRWGSLRGKRVLDLGCGWGSLSVELARAGAEVTFVDLDPIHIEIASLRVGGGRGIVADARDLSPLSGQPPFDHVLMHSLIEHVGHSQVEGRPEHHGDAARSLADKRRVLRAAASVLAPGGTAFLSTGNYAFPVDGETKTWFFHWLPLEEQRRLLEARKVDADHFGLLRWDELEALCGDAGLIVRGVETCEVANYGLMLRLISFVSARAGFHLPRFEIDQLVRLMETDPGFMPVWFVFLERAG